MNYIKLPYMDSEVSIFAICQAHQQLESDYNVGGILRERPSNQRRSMSTGCQLHRMDFNSGHWWVDITSPDEEEDPDDKDVREIYLLNVLNWKLPISPELGGVIKELFAEDWLSEKFPDWEARIEVGG